MTYPVSDKHVMLTRKTEHEEQLDKLQHAIGLLEAQVSLYDTLLAQLKDKASTANYGGMLRQLGVKLNG